MHSFRIHSKYNPHKEAEQFASTVEGHPSIIVVSEPGESYLAPVLKQRFPTAKLLALRYTDSYFCDSDVSWTAVWRPANGSLPFFLLSHIPDEKLASVRFLSWKPADKVFPEAAAAVWKDIRYAIEIMKSIMHTRSFFGTRWLKNTVYNFIHLAHPATPDFGTQNFILAGAGPSLQTLCAEETKDYSTATVCSAYPALAEKNLRVDLCISTDGGYWAARHFDRLPTTIPVAFPLEAAIPATVLEHNPCIPLSYNSPLEKRLFALAGFMPLAARENGTVMGTACELLLAHTDSKIVLAGLDLAPSSGFSHAQPHNSTLQALCAANRLHPLANMLSVQNFQIVSLETYRQWFLQLPSEKTQRLFRIGSGGSDLPNIQRIASAAELIQNSQQPSRTQYPFSVCSSSPPSITERKKIVRDLLTSIQKQIFASIQENTEILTGEATNLEKQICALCSYTAYCNFIKDSTNKDMQMLLHTHISDVLNPLIKRLTYDDF